LAITHAGVWPEVIPPEPAARFVEAFFAVHDLAEWVLRDFSGFFFTQPLLSQALSLALQVCFDFGVKSSRLRLRLNMGSPLPPPSGLNYSFLSATSGSTRNARRAGI
jgi:hypothetical protein